MNAITLDAPSVAQVSEADMESAICDNPAVLLAFVDPDSPASQALLAAFGEAAQRHQDFFFGSIDGGVEQHLAAAFRVSQMPTLIAIRDQILVIRRSGSLDAATLHGLIEQVRLLDMDDIRTEIAAHEGDEDAIDW